MTKNILSMILLTIACMASEAGANPWVPTAELIARGKAVYAQQCVICHGAEGKADGPASAAMNPTPRNFTVADGWKNGRKPSQIFNTLTKGLNSMPSFSAMSVEERWSLSHYVATLGPGGALKDTPADLAKAGVDTSGKGGGSAEKVLPIELAIEIMAIDGKFAKERK